MGERFDAHRIYLLENTIQDYAWGSPTAIPQLLGRPPDGRPQAELWMGAHPKAPSLLTTGTRSLPLIELIERAPHQLLGRSVTERYGARLPFLFKVLAASKALSIQAHPNLAQAREGYRREEGDGIARDAPTRNYRDDNHKPEVLCALGDFWGMRGFRPVEETLADFALFDNPELARLSGILAADRGADGLRHFLTELLETEASRARAMTEAVAMQCVAEDGDRFRWVERLAGEYPGDVGVIAPLFLNTVKLRTGEAIYQKAGELHAYLEGTGIELMANSDNVLRGGLTQKHIDVPELLRVLTFNEGTSATIRPRSTSSGVQLYDTPTREFRLSRIAVAPAMDFLAERDRSVELLLCVEGSALLRWSGGELAIAKGGSALVPAAVDGYSMGGKAVVFRADVPPAGIVREGDS